MRSSIPTAIKNLWFWPFILMSQSLLNEVKYSNVKGVDPFDLQNLMSQSLLNEVKYSNSDLEDIDVVGLWVAIPFKWGQVFQLAWRLAEIIKSLQSQSLLNEVKYSNGRILLRRKKMLLEVAIPFKWGQVFQLFKEEKMVERELEVAIPFKWGQVFQRQAL